jgi:hypothetical protein
VCAVKASSRRSRKLGKARGQHRNHEHSILQQQSGWISDRLRAAVHSLLVTGLGKRLLSPLHDSRPVGCFVALQSVAVFARYMFFSLPRVEPLPKFPYISVFTLAFFSVGSNYWFSRRRSSKSSTVRIYHEELMSNSQKCVLNLHHPTSIEVIDRETQKRYSCHVLYTCVCIWN